jgi:hypothetical protein
MVRMERKARIQRTAFQSRLKAGVKPPTLACRALWQDAHRWRGQPQQSREPGHLRNGDQGMLGITRDWWFRFACVLLLVGVVLWIASGSPTTAQICNEASQSKIEECSTHNILLVFFWYLGKWLDVFSVVIGEITYADDLGTRRRTAFHRTYERTREKFDISTDPDLEYCD